MEIKVGDLFVLGRVLFRLVSGPFYDIHSKCECVIIEHFDSKEQESYPVIFMNKAERIQDELMARILFTNLTPEQALNIHKLSKCPISLRGILAQRMQLKWVGDANGQ